MSIKLIVTRGFGNGIFLGTIKDLVTRGYNISTVIPPSIPTSRGLLGAGSTGLGITGEGTTERNLLGSQSAGSGITGSGSL